MKINIGIGNISQGNVNTLILSEESVVANLEIINDVLLASKVLFSESELQLGENRYNLTLYFIEPYASFKSIFNASSYLAFKTSLGSIFPELLDQFSALESKVLTQEELNNSLYELQEYERYGFFGSKDYIDLIKERIHNLERRL